MTPDSVQPKTDLPAGWVWTTLGEITQVVEKTQPRERPDEQFTYLDISSIDNTANMITDPKVYLGKDAPSRARQVVFSEDVLFSTVRPYLKNVALVTEHYDGQIASTGFSVLRGMPGVSGKYLFYYCLTNEFLEELGKHQRGVSYPAVRDRDVRNQRIPLAPTPEQHRIIAEIDTLFTRIDASALMLKRVQANLQRLEASVLKSACEGRLVYTEAEMARRESRDYESAGTLLQRILAERRARWEAENPKKEYQEPLAPNTDDLPELPEGWVWATWDQLSTRVTVGHVGKMKDEYVEYGIPFLRSQNVRENRFDPVGLVYISNEFHRTLSKSTLHSGDLVVVRSGSVGVTCVIPDMIDEANCSDLVIIKRPIHVLPEYGSFFMNSLAKSRVKTGRVGVALIHFNTKSVAALSIAIPPLAEQSRIVTEVEQRLSIVQELKAAVGINLKRAERLRQSILKQAFDGRLVANDSHDEPANVLLETIRIERKEREQAEQTEGAPRKKETTVTRTATERRPLHKILVEADKPMTPEDLFSQAGFSVDDIDAFYDELRREIVQLGRLEEVRPNRRVVLIKAVDHEC